MQPLVYRGLFQVIPPVNLFTKGTKMSRIVLTDDSGKWFDSEKAVKFEENTRWNGNNHISCATGSQWDHEWLYYTAGGKWVLNSWSQYQGSLESYCEICEETAVQWLISQSKFDEVESLPEGIRKEVEDGIAAAEL